MGDVLAAIRDLRAGKVSDDEVAAARETSLASLRTAMSTAEGAMATYALWLGLGTDPERLRELPARLVKVRTEEIVRVANFYLSEDSIRVLFVRADRELDVRPLGLGPLTGLALPP